LPLHKQLKNLYRKNRGFQSQNRKIKAKLQHFKDELAQRNLNFLVEATIEREEPIEKKSTPTVKKTTPAKEKHVVVIKGSSPLTRRSARLRK
jgi:dsDNA-specific endonuclease/ATPase MutS2